MTVTIKQLRKISRGIVGTYENANHHAKPCVPLIKILEATITQMGTTYDFSWEQGNNVHIIEREDGQKIVLRPFVNGERIWGIDVLSRFSRRDEIPLFSITEISEASFFGIYLELFLLRGMAINTYGSREHRNNSRVQ